MIEFQNVCIHAGDFRLQDISFEISSGQYVLRPSSDDLIYSVVIIHHVVLSNHQQVGSLWNDWISIVLCPEGVLCIILIVEPSVLRALASEIAILWRNEISKYS